MGIKHLRIVNLFSIGFFLLAAILGALMRLFWLVEIPVLDYKHILHSHSHTALLGWAFMAMGSSFVYFLISDKKKLLKLKNALIFHVVACVGMFIAFLYQGYGIVSIAFSTIALVVIYYFSYEFLKALKTEKKSLSVSFGRWAIYWLLVSTLGLWLIAPVEAYLGKLHPAYFGSIQFFLHFQFNGWITYGILALIFKHCENQGVKITLPRPTFAILQVSLILTYTLSVTWSTPESYLFYINSAGVLLQILAFGILLYSLRKSIMNLFKGNKTTSALFLMGILSLMLKVLIQGAVAIPYIAKVSYTIRNFVIGFIHLTMLGSFSLVILAFWLYYEMLSYTVSLRVATTALIVGFVGTEFILFVQGILLWAGKGFIPAYYSILFIITMLLPIGLFLLLLNELKKSRKPQLL